MSIDIALSWTDGDLTMVSDSNEVIQHIRSRLLVQLGEHFMDDTIGVDWLGFIFNTTISVDLKIAEIKKVIQETPGVNTIRSFDFNMDNAQHKLTITYVADTIYGDVSDEVNL